MLNKLIDWFVAFMVLTDEIFNPKLVEHNEQAVLWQELFRSAGIDLDEN